MTHKLSELDLMFAEIMMRAGYRISIKNGKVIVHFDTDKTIQDIGVEPILAKL